ncbi:MAG: hypothetical protein U9M95_06875 [Candidatus Altiarchaeota archaeon]|nr:hypothetical protein [Candidatus Altiarchaeota archaeon]
MKETVFFLLIIVLVSTITAQINHSERVSVQFIYSKTCPHCAEEKVFLNQLENKYPRLEVERYSVEENNEIFEELSLEYGTIPVGVPRTFIGDKPFIGFTSEGGELKWYESYRAYYGYSNVLENEIRDLMDLAPLICECEAVDISRVDAKVVALLEEHPESEYTIILVNETYRLGWWTWERILSNLGYPNVLVDVNAKTGELLDSRIPQQPVLGVEKPPRLGENRMMEVILAVFVLYCFSYALLRKRMEHKYWVSGLFLLVIAAFFAVSQSLPTGDVLSFAKSLSFPGFTFVLALADGFNPCAFAVLAFLLSLLTHTRSRKKMLVIGSVFILTSGFMYSLFIILLLTIRSTLLSGFQEYVRVLVALVALTAGVINMKDFFYFKKGISLTMSDENSKRVYGKAGKLVQKVNRAQSKRELLIAVAATMVLATLVNVIELGCTFILPMEYIEVLLANYPEPIGLIHLVHTFFYGAVYTIPLFAILGSFIYSFKSERMSKEQGRILKLVGGIIMISLGLILLFKPELLMFG